MTLDATLPDETAMLAELDAGVRAAKARLCEARDTLGGALTAGEITGIDAMRAQAGVADATLRALHTRAVAEAAAPAARDVAVVAAGGYGRGELAPFSDLDVLFLVPDQRAPGVARLVETILYGLWDLGFQVGHATRTVGECIQGARRDTTIRTSLLEIRHLCGDGAHTAALQRRFAAEVQTGTAARFIAEKLRERDERHARLGDSRYQLEPNIKDGKGGLRDLNTLFWIAKDVYRVADGDALVDRGVFTRDEARRFAQARQVLWTVRFHLHLTAGRARERLTFDLQKEIAPRMGYRDHARDAAVERFMKHYYLVAKDVGDLTRILCAHLESVHGRRSRFRPRGRRHPRTAGGFPLAGDRPTVSTPETFRADPAEMLRIFSVAHARNLDIHPTALRWMRHHRGRLRHTSVRQDADANAHVLALLTATRDPAPTLRRMNEAGVLGRFIPAFGRVVAQMQYDMYHHYTVDEHTLVALRELTRIERGELREVAPIASDVVHRVHDRRALHVALFLHDMGKGLPGDHSEVGARLARGLCPRLGLSPAETETVAWLVANHLAMSHVAFKRDLEEPRTIRDFAARVGSLERLRLLLCLTVADIRAVGPRVWTDWKAALLRDLFWHTEDELAGGFRVEARDTRVQRAKAALRERLAAWPEAEVARHLARPYPAYWLAWETETHARHAELIHRAEAEGRRITVEQRVDGYRDVTEVTIYTQDHPGLFARIAGAMAVAGASITAARIFTLTNGMALDTLWITEPAGGAFAEADKLAALPSTVARTITGELAPARELHRRRSGIPSRYAAFTVAPRVVIDNSLAPHHTVIEVEGRDRPGLLHDLTRMLAHLNLIIHRAKISTYGERVIDVFYVADVLGGRVMHDSKLARIRQRLTEVLERPLDTETRDRPVMPVET